MRDERLHRGPLRKNRRPHGTLPLSRQDLSLPPSVLFNFCSAFKQARKGSNSQAYLLRFLTPRAVASDADFLSCLASMRHPSVVPVDHMLSRGLFSRTCVPVDPGVHDMNSLQVANRWANPVGPNGTRLPCQRTEGRDGRSRRRDLAGTDPTCPFQEPLADNLYAHWPVLISVSTYSCRQSIELAPFRPPGLVL